MPDSPQAVYVRHLLSHRGYPLWTPEPSRRLPQVYLQEGLRIGDVGVVVPENGSFDVFFNICLPPDHPLHRRGVPDNFNPIGLDKEDIDIFPRAEEPRRVIPSTFFHQVNLTDGSHARVEYDISLPPTEGALLILPQGADHHDLRIRRRFLEEALQHAVEWYDFAEQRLHRIISHGSLYLITGFYKARSWSLASFPDVTGTSDFHVQYIETRLYGCYWRHGRALDWRVGLPDELSNGIPNQSVFISGFKIAISDELLVWKRITVRVETEPDQPEVSNVVGRGAWLPKLIQNFAQMGSTSEAGRQHNMSSESSSGTSPARSSASNTSSIIDNRIEITHVPQIPKMSHPSDIVNQWLFSKVPSAKVAVTHDSQWSSLLESGELDPEDLLKEGGLESVLSVYNDIVFENGAVFLQPKACSIQCGVLTLNTPGGVQDNENANTTGQWMQHGGSLNTVNNRASSANAGEVEDLQEQAGLQYRKGVASIPASNNMNVVSGPQGFDPDSNWNQKTSTTLAEIFADVVGCDEIIKRLHGYQKIVQETKGQRRDMRTLIPSRFAFMGPPGSGKHTIAWKLAEVYYHMGYLASAQVVKCSETDLLDLVVGQNQPKVKSVFEKSLGKVLFIDAYLLKSHSAKEGLDGFVGLMTNERFMNKLVIVLTGDKDTMDSLLFFNPGLSGCFSEKIVFQNMTTEQCLELLNKTLSRRHTTIPELSDRTSLPYLKMQGIITQLLAFPSWHYGYIKKLGNDMAQKASFDNMISDGTSLLSAEEALGIMEEMLQDLQTRHGATPSESSSAPGT